MSLFRTPMTLLRSRALRSIPRLPPTQIRHVGDYGSGAGDPKGENPQQQGSNPSADKEHPGPPPPKAGEGTGGATKADSTGHNTGSSKQGGGTSDGKRQFSTFARRVRTYATEARPKDTKNVEPKILSESPPSGEQASSEVKKHNAEMDARAEKAHESVEPGQEEKDKVSKKFWSGHGGADRDP